MAASIANSRLQILGSGPFLLPWTTDASQLAHTTGDDRSFPATYGPDGPWQAVVVGVGELSSSSPGPRNAPALQPLYPCGASVTQVLDKALGGTYSIHDSKTAIPIHATAANVDDWYASIMLNESTFGADAYDGVQLGESAGSTRRSRRSFTAVSTIFAASQRFDITLPSGKTYRNNLGTLGLGRQIEFHPRHPHDAPISMLQQMLNDGMIPSASFGLHIGSVPQNMSGSLALGGYDIARALGPVGSFWYEQGTPFAALRDINLGFETGGSPFDSNDLEHLYLGNNGSKIAEMIRESFGAPNGSTMVIPNPATPYISLPHGNCENIAKRLPVTWQPDIGFYTWNQHDPRYTKIVNSPAWMQFVLQGPDGHDIAIKVPFKLLDLTLEPPIVAEPTPYFPCRPWDSAYGFYALGRAFLQGAFLGVNYGTNKIWLAQAPGPDMVDSRIVPIEQQDATIKTTRIESFEESWARHWDPLPVEASTNISRSPFSTFGGLLSINDNMHVILAAMVAIGALLWLALRRLRTTTVADRFHGPVNSIKHPLLMGEACRDESKTVQYR